jgi:hypothetical protein
MFIEASGISEPSETADCEDDHNHEHDHAKVLLSDVATLDTLRHGKCPPPTLETFMPSPQRTTAIRFGRRSSRSRLSTRTWSSFTRRTSFRRHNFLKSKNMSLFLNPTAKLLQAHTHALLTSKELLTRSSTMLCQVQHERCGCRLRREKKCCQASHSARESLPAAVTARTIETRVLSGHAWVKQAATTRHEARFGRESFLYCTRRVDRSTPAGS